MKRETVCKTILMGVVTAAALSFAGCGDMERGNVISLEMLGQKIEVTEDKTKEEEDIDPTSTEKKTGTESEQIAETGTTFAMTEEAKETATDVSTPDKQLDSTVLALQPLLDKTEIAQIKIVNGNNGAMLYLTEGEYFEQILSFYEQLQLADDGEKNKALQALGYRYTLTLYDEEFNELQTIIPRAGEVDIDGIVYKEKETGIGNELIQYIEENYEEILDSLLVICHYPLNDGNTDNTSANEGE